VKRVWAALKPKGFRVKSMRKMASSIQGPSVCGPGFGPDLPSGLDLDSGSDLEPDLVLILDVEADFGVISVLLASSLTSSVSLPSPVSSLTSLASQPSSLAFARSSDEPGSLSVMQTPSSEPSSFIDLSEGFEFVCAFDLPVPEAQLLVNGLTEAHAWYLGWLRDGTRSHEMRRKNEVVPPSDCSMVLP
jgi:hypothetical protein